MTLADQFVSALKARPDANADFVRLTEREQILCDLIDRKLDWMRRVNHLSQPRFHQE
jgi:hypothetical protein